MSGICGIVALDGSRPGKGDLEAILEPLKRRGPDGSGTWLGEGAALGHTLLATTPEALVEKLPLHHGESGCSITADARLDNRDELFAKIGGTGAGHVIGDGELILQSYLKWGEDCVDHLLGDFAFAIWDARARRLFCARDQMGMRQLAYAHVPGRAFVFATEPVAGLRHTSVPQGLNLGRIADFLDDLENFSFSETFYEAILRLPPAHTLIVDGTGLQLRRYWRLATPPPLKLGSDEDYVEGFLDVFRTAVQARLRSPGPIGAMLSGGMDSGSVVAVAAELLAEQGRGPLPTFSVVGSDPDICPETRAIHAAASIEGIQPLRICLSDMGSEHDELIRLTREEAEPFDGHMGLLRAVYFAAHRRGLKVLLDGVGGDLAFQSTSYVARLLRRGRLIHATAEARAEAKFWGSDTSFRSLFVESAARAWVPRPLRVARRTFGWWMNDRRIGRVGLISSEFARQVNLRQRRRQLRLRDSGFDRLDGDERRRRIDHANLVVGRERYDRVASQVGIEPRDPFMDLRLVEFSLALPWDQLQSEGWPKMLLRRAMAGKLPDRVRWRRGKEHLGWAFTKQLFSHCAERGLTPEVLSETNSPYVDFRWAEGESARDEFFERCPEWIDAILLGLWLSSTQSVSRDDSGRSRS